MPSDAIPIDPQDFPSYVSESLLVNYAFIAGLSWYAYEYILTLPSEFEVIWKSKPNITIILFLINRYTFMFSWVLSIVSISTITSDTVCTILASFVGVTNRLCIISISGIFILRTYAICGRNKWILGLLSLLFLTRFGVSIWSIIGQIGRNAIVIVPGVDGVGNCVNLSSVKPIAIEVSLTVVFDTIVFILTVSRTWILCCRAKAAGVETKLSALLLRDGSLYFGLLSAGAVLYVIAVFDENLPPFLSFMGRLAAPLEIILANRLVLNLRTHSQPNDLSIPTTTTDVFFQQVYGGTHTGGRLQSSLDSFLRDIGAPLRVGFNSDLGDEFGDSEGELPRRE